MAEASDRRNPYDHFTAGSQCWAFDNASSGQTEHAALRRRQVKAANAYLASLEPAMALQVIQDSPLLRDLPAGSIMISVQDADS